MTGLLKLWLPNPTIVAMWFLFYLGPGIRAAYRSGDRPRARRLIIRAAGIVALAFPLAWFRKEALLAVDLAMIVGGLAICRGSLDDVTRRT